MVRQLDIRRLLAGTSLAVLCACTSGKQDAAPLLPINSTTIPTVDPASVNADELGEVPVLMYHRVVANPKSALDVAPEVFREELVRFAQAGFVTVTAAQFASGEFDIPAGKHPIVLTFDDGWKSHVSLLPSGEPDPSCAAAIMQSVAKEFPGFRGTATFFVNREPFGDPTGQALRWAVSHGFEIGNHTLTHPRLSRLKNFQSQREIVKLERHVAELDPSVKIRTIALPYGLSPKTESYARIGMWNKTTYRYDGVFLAGANPSRSPYDERFNPLRIPRIVSDAQQQANKLSPASGSVATADSSTSSGVPVPTEAMLEMSAATELASNTAVATDVESPADATLDATSDPPTGETSETTNPAHQMTAERETEAAADAKFSSTAWFARFDDKPSVLYTSDGDPNRISFPAERARFLAAAWSDRANPYGSPAIPNS